MSVAVAVEVKLPIAVHMFLTTRADETGLFATEVVNDILADAAGIESPPVVKLLKALSAWLRAAYGPQPTAFPPDVTLAVFKHVLDTPPLREFYDAAVAGPDGKPNEKNKRDVHQRLGAMVKQVLKAKVVGRSNPLDASKWLIKSHALLAPTT